ncbi:uncharacterized protein VP01_6113g1 [Puccinia sorghi]|uniref:Uncharacterized protein n=1 Tax=Puccinia sorghi TaxID=27349 RepID=A0A0L6UHS2_9BASI|nr:uncharacterized protein VP01_6113g1 [Puccinia sorghi]
MRLKNLSFSVTWLVAFTILLQFAQLECFVHVYVNYMIITSHDVDQFNWLISSQFCKHGAPGQRAKYMEDLGNTKNILVIKLTC